MLPEPLELLCHSRAGVAINQQMNAECHLQPHQDWKDVKSPTDAVIPYGDYDGGDLILWQVKCILELRPGDALLFMGSLICHGNTRITRGIRNSVNLFTHKCWMDWIRRDPSTRKKRSGDMEPKPKSQPKPKRKRAKAKDTNPSRNNRNGDATRKRLRRG